MKKLLPLSFIIILIFGIWGCEKELSPENIPFEAEISEDASIFLSVAEDFKIEISPSNAQIEYSVIVDPNYKNPTKGVISVSSDGKIKALEAGKATLIIKNNTGALEFDIIVVELPSDIALSDSTIIIKTGREIQLELNHLFDDYELNFFGGIKWEIIDNTIATISDSGKIVALKEGETTVKISLNNFPEIYVEIKVHITDYIVYILGECISDHNQVKPSYWINNFGIGSLLDDIAFTVNDIMYSNENIYIVGRSSVPDKAFMLKNNSKTTFSESGAGATGVDLLGEDIYTCGYYTYSDILTVALWKNNSLFPILDDSEINSESIGTSIMVSGNDIYVGGYIRNNQNKSVACYWKNKQRVDLSTGTTDAIVNSIFVDDQDVYAVGSYTGVVNNSLNSIACYWKNGVKYDLISAGSDARSIFVYNGDVYITGYYYIDNNYAACYWENGVKTDLSTGSDAVNSGSTAIKVVDNNIFISGFYSDSNGNTTGCYWKNGVRFDLTPTIIGTETYPYSSAASLTID